MDTQRVNGRFVKGHKGIGGRPVGGRAEALRLLDAVCAKPKNLKKLVKAMQVEFDADPMKFFREFVIPLAPKSVEMTDVMAGLFADKTPQEAAERMDALTIGNEPRKQVSAEPAMAVGTESGSGGGVVPVSKESISKNQDLDGFDLP